METVVNGANTGWVLICAALVMLMTPGLAFFYGGMSRSKSVLNMLMMSFTALGIVSVLWVVYGYAIAFGTSRGGLFGWSSGLVGLGDIVDGVTLDQAEDGVVNTFGLPDLAFSGFQVMFAVITVALISGAIADRMKFGSWVAFTVLWSTLVYFPVAHWVFAFGVAEEDGEGAGASAGLFAADSGGWIVNRLGALAGLVAITPAAGAVNPLGAIAIGLVAGVLCCLAVTFKHRLGYDDALDVVGVHLVGGLVGTLMIGVVADSEFAAGYESVLDGGSFSLLGRQALAAGATMAYSFVATLIIALLVKAVLG